MLDLVTIKNIKFKQKLEVIFPSNFIFLRNLCFSQFSEIVGLYHTITKILSEGYNEGLPLQRHTLF